MLDEREKLTLKVSEEHNDYSPNDFGDVPYILIHLGRHGMMKVQVDGDGVNGYIIDVYDINGEIIHESTVWEEDIANPDDDEYEVELHGKDYGFNDNFWYKLITEFDEKPIQIGGGCPTRNMAIVELNKYAREHPKQKVYVEVIKLNDDGDGEVIENIFPMKSAFRT